jgi:hypothetical protein
MPAQKPLSRNRRDATIGFAFAAVALCAYFYYQTYGLDVERLAQGLSQRMPSSAEDPLARERFQTISLAAIKHLDKDGSGAIDNLNAEMDPYWDARLFFDEFVPYARFEFSDGHPDSNFYYDRDLKTFYLNRHASDEELALRLAAFIDRTNYRQWVPGIDLISQSDAPSVEDLAKQYEKSPG